MVLYLDVRKSLKRVRFDRKSLISRVVNGSVPVWVHGGPGTKTVKKKVEPDPNPELFQNQSRNHI